MNVDELRRLAPAVPFQTALIGAHAEQGKLRIWGIAHSGPAWLAPTWGGRSLVPNWTYDPIIHVTGPGQLAVRCAGKLVGAISLMVKREHRRAELGYWIARDRWNNGYATEARRTVDTTITLANLDSVAAGDLVYVCVNRVPSDVVNDTLSVDSEFLVAVLTYTS